MAADGRTDSPNPSKSAALKVTYLCESAAAASAQHKTARPRSTNPRCEVPEQLVKFYSTVSGFILRLYYSDLIGFISVLSW